MKIVSFNTHENIVRHCTEGGVAECMKLILGNQERKSLGIERFCREHGVSVTETIYVGDFPSDMSEAKKANAIAVGITRGEDMWQALVSAGADHCIEHLHELIPLVEK